MDRYQEQAGAAEQAAAAEQDQAQPTEQTGAAERRQFDEQTRQLADRVAQVRQQVERLRAERLAESAAAAATFAEYARSTPFLGLTERPVDHGGIGGRPGGATGPGSGRLRALRETARHSLPDRYDGGPPPGDPPAIPDRDDQP